MARLKDFTDVQLAHGLARIGLGINIALHGWTRVFQFPAFQRYLATKFERSPLPQPLVGLSAYVITAAEAVIGLLLLAGWQTRGALAAGQLLICGLLAGTCLIQDWATAGDQLIYLAFFGVLLATLKHGGLGVDFRGQRMDSGH